LQEPQYEEKEMRKQFTALLVGAALMMLAGVVGATPVSFDVAGGTGGSNVSVTNQNSLLTPFDNGTISAALVGNLDAQLFTLGNNESKIIDFFTLTVSGFSLKEAYNVRATLAFDVPDIDAIGSGKGSFTTFFGCLSAGTLTWDPATIPDFFTVNGNTVKVDFESGYAFGFGDTATIHATITNQGGGSAPVPEPGTMMLLGVGMLGLVIFGKRRMNKES
jgi:hypothetical protein